MAATRIGVGETAQRVSQGSMLSIAASAPTKASVVCRSITQPKPASARTFVMSLVARDMRSPVRRT
jgi:hypothetical protein